MVMLLLASLNTQKKAPSEKRSAGEPSINAPFLFFLARDKLLSVRSSFISELVKTCRARQAKFSLAQ